MRVFVAIELPQDTKDRIEIFEELIKKSIPLRFVASQNLHLTLFFLSEVTEERISEVVESVKAGSQEVKPFYLSLGKPEFFSHGLWICVEGQVEVLNKFYKQVKKALEARSFQVEARPFSAHITLGRCKKGISSIKGIKSITGITGKFEVDSVGIFASKLTPKGPIYTKLVDIVLQ